MVTKLFLLLALGSPKFGLYMLPANFGVKPIFFLAHVMLPLASSSTTEEGIHAGLVYRLLSRPRTVTVALAPPWRQRALAPYSSAVHWSKVNHLEAEEYRDHKHDASDSGLQ
jgi:hypothetical protein